MGFEPNAAQRLRLVWATTRDPRLRSALRTVIENPGMSFVPTPDLLRQVAACPACDPTDGEPRRQGLCDTHRARWNLEMCLADSGEPAASGDRALDHIMTGVLSSEHSGRAVLAAMERQLRALHMVWEAHERGAVRLPERVAELVRVARFNLPPCLPAAADQAVAVEQTS